MINLHIVDDHKIMVEGLSLLINMSGVAQVDKVYYDLASCIEGLTESLPDVLLLDIELPDGDGVDFCAEIKKIYPELKIIILSTYKESGIVKRALHNGALGYILKDAENAELLLGIEAVNSGKLFLCEEISRLLGEKNGEYAIWLSRQERVILKYLADGYTTREIADMICRSPEAVKALRRSLLVKFNAKSVAVLIEKAYNMKLIE